MKITRIGKHRAEARAKVHPKMYWQFGKALLDGIGICGLANIAIRQHRPKRRLPVTTLLARKGVIDSQLPTIHQIRHRQKRGLLFGIDPVRRQHGEHRAGLRRQTQK